jgi:hypothetical protein
MLKALSCHSSIMRVKVNQDMQAKTVKRVQTVTRSVSTQGRRSDIYLRLLISNSSRVHSITQLSEWTKIYTHPSSCLSHRHGILRQRPTIQNGNPEPPRHQARYSRVRACTEESQRPFTSSPSKLANCTIPAEYKYSRHLSQTRELPYHILG